METIRYTGDASVEELTEIEQIALIERDPVGSAQGVSTGLVLAVGEVTKDNGTPNVPFLALSEGHFRQKFGEPSDYLGSDANGYEGALHRHVEGLRQIWPMVVIPVDAEAGTVALSRPSPGVATLLGTVAEPFNLGTPDGSMDIDIDGDGGETVDFSASRASLTGAGATYAAVDPGVELHVKVDDGATQVVAAAGTENSQALWHDLLNAGIVGAHVVNVGGQTKIESDTYGNNSKIEILSTSGATALAALGLEADSDAVTGEAFDDFRAATAEEVAAVIQAVFTAEDIDATASAVGGRVQIVSNNAVPASGSVQITDTTGIGAIIGFDEELHEGGGGTAPAVTVKAGSRITETVSEQVWLTLEDVVFAEDDLGGDEDHTVRVQQAYGTDADAAFGTAVTLTDQPSGDSTLVASITADGLSAKNDAAWATAYEAALVLAMSDNIYTTLAGYFVAARHTEAIAALLLDAATERSTSGRGAKAIVAPPVGTDYATVISSSGWGIDGSTHGARSDRKWYAWGGLERRIKVGGEQVIAGLTCDFALAMLEGRILPEESPGTPNPTVMAPFIGLTSELDTVNSAARKILKAKGVITPRYHTQFGFYFQSAVTTSLETGKAPIPRRDMVDYIGDSIAVKSMPYKDRPISLRILSDLGTEIETFLQGLLDAGRIAGKTFANITTAEDRAEGIVKFSVVVDLLGNMSTIAFYITAQPGALGIDIAEAA